MFCPNCGHEIPDSSAFCPYCGQPIEKEDILEDTETQEPQNSTSESESSSAYKEASQTISYAQNSEPLDPSFSSKSKPKKKLGVIIGVVIAIIIAAAGGFYFMNRDDPIKIVKGMRFDSYSDRQIGKYFENFFTNCKWLTYVRNKHNYVRFDGYTNKNHTINKLKVEMDFRLNKDNDEFQLTKTLIDGDNYRGEYQENDLLDLIFNGVIDATDGPKDQGESKANIKKLSNLKGTYIATRCIAKDQEYDLSDIEDEDDLSDLNDLLSASLKLKSKDKYTIDYKDEKKSGKASLKNHHYWQDLILSNTNYYPQVDRYGRIQFIDFSAESGAIAIIFTKTDAEASGGTEETTQENDDTDGTSDEGDPIDVDEAMNDPDGYLLPNVDSEYLTDNDLYNFSEYQLKLAKNEIYARHGYLFKNSTLDAYFRGKSWYSHMVNVSDETTHDASVVEGRMNSIEKANLDFIVEYAKNKGYSI